MTKPLPTKDLPLKLQIRLRGLIMTHTPHIPEYSMSVNGPDGQVTLALYDGWDVKLVFDLNTQTCTLCEGTPIPWTTITDTIEGHTYIWTKSTGHTLPRGFVYEWHAAIKAVIVYLQTLRG